VSFFIHIRCSNAGLIFCVQLYVCSRKERKRLIFEFWHRINKQKRQINKIFLRIVGKCLMLLNIPPLKSVFQCGCGVEVSIVELPNSRSWSQIGQVDKLSVIGESQIMGSSQFNAIVTWIPGENSVLHQVNAEDTDGLIFQRKSHSIDGIQSIYCIMHINLTYVREVKSGENLRWKMRAHRGLSNE
jgi:hypothetical protein